MNVPRDLAMVGYDDIEAAAWTSPALTTIRQPLSRMGELGGRAIVDRIAHHKSGVAKTLLRCELVIRESCGAGILAKGAPA